MNLHCLLPLLVITGPVLLRQVFPSHKVKGKLPLCAAVLAASCRRSRHHVASVGARMVAILGHLLFLVLLMFVPPYWLVLVVLSSLFLPGMLLVLECPKVSAWGGAACAVLLQVAELLPVQKSKEEG